MPLAFIFLPSFETRQNFQNSSVRKVYVLGRLCPRLWLVNFSFLLQKSLHLCIPIKKQTIQVSWAHITFHEQSGYRISTEQDNDVQKSRSNFMHQYILAFSDYCTCIFTLCSVAELPSRYPSPRIPQPCVLS